MVQLSYTKKPTLKTPQGGGHHGHSSIIMNPELYTTLSTMVWADSPNPGVYAKITLNGTTVHQDQPQRQHNEGGIIYKNIGTMDKALKNKVFNAFEDTYLKELKNKYTRFLGVTCRDLLDYLLDRYGKITTADLKDNNIQINETIELFLLIENIFECINKCFSTPATAIRHTRLHK